MPVQACGSPARQSQGGGHARLHATSWARRAGTLTGNQAWPMQHGILVFRRAARCRARGAGIQASLSRPRITKTLCSTRTRRPRRSASTRRTTPSTAAGAGPSEASRPRARYRTGRWETSTTIVPARLPRSLHQARWRRAESRRVRTRGYQAYADAVQAPRPASSRTKQTHGKAHLPSHASHHVTTSPQTCEGRSGKCRAEDADPLRRPRPPEQERGPVRRRRGSTAATQSSMGRARISGACAAPKILDQAVECVRRALPAPPAGVPARRRCGCAALADPAPRARVRRRRRPGGRNYFVYYAAAGVRGAGGVARPKTWRAARMLRSSAVRRTTASARGRTLSSSTRDSRTPTWRRPTASPPARASAGAACLQSAPRASSTGTAWRRA